MDPIVEILQRIEEKLDLDVFLIIMDFVEKHHIELGRERWKQNMTNVHEEYKKLIRIAWLSTSEYPWEDSVQEIELSNWQHCTDPEEFDHDFSCRSFNFRDMDYACHNTEERRTEYSGMHWPPITIANSMKVKSTYCLLPENYYYQRLYPD